MEEEVLKDKMDNHYNILLIFLIGNIVIQIIYFVVIKFFILDKIEGVLSNLERLSKNFKFYIIKYLSKNIYGIY